MAGRHIAHAIRHAIRCMDGVCFRLLLPILPFCDVLTTTSLISCMEIGTRLEDGGDGPVQLDFHRRYSPQQVALRQVPVWRSPCSRLK